MPRLQLVYDGGCGFCRRCVRWLLERDLWDVLVPIPNDAPGIEERTGLTKEQLDESVWIIDDAGRALHGAAAVNRALQALRGPYGLAGTAGRLPGLSALEGGLYRAVASQRTLASRLWSDPPPTT